MKIVGLIAEYNPFHNGHEYHIQKAKEVTGADTVIVVMSGNFVQRGAPAIMPKHLRAKVALKSGASLVLELPVCFATEARNILPRAPWPFWTVWAAWTPCVSGANVEDIQPLTRIAEVLSHELKNTGLSFVLRSKRGFPFHLPENGLCRIIFTILPCPGFWQARTIHWSGIHQSTDPAGKHNPALYHSPERLPVSC